MEAVIGIMNFINGQEEKENQMRTENEKEKQLSLIQDQLSGAQANKNQGHNPFEQT